MLHDILFYAIDGVTSSSRDREENLQQIQSIPRRTAYALSSTIYTSPWAAAWDRVYRQVFWLSDGQRSTERMAMLLHKSEDSIARIVGELVINGYLSLRGDKKVLEMNVELLKESFNLVAPQKEEFARSFYERLFSYYPQTRPLFAQTDMRRQESSLMATLAVVVAGVQRGDNLVPVLHSLGKRHEQHHGVAPEYYPLVGGVLLETFHDYLGPQFTPTMQDAWSQAFELISNQMIEGKR